MDSQKKNNSLIGRQSEPEQPVRAGETTEALKEEEFHRVLFDTSPIGLVMFDEKLKFLNCSGTILKMFQTTEEYFINNFYEFMPEYQPDGVKSRDKATSCMNLALSGEDITFEFLHKSSAGELIPCEITMARISSNKEYIGLAYIYDLRRIRSKEQELLKAAEREREERLQREAAQASDEAKSRFLAHMSHEIRTPMNAILGLSELLMQDNLSRRQLRYVEDIKISTMSLLEIINDILDVSKIQAGKLSLMPAHFDFSAMIDNIGSIARLLIGDKNVSYKLDIQDGTPRYLYGDDARLRQVLLNLISNAIKFTEKGYVQLSIGYTDTALKMTVSDTGVGIPAEKIPKLFDPFEQADRNRRTMGTGLGLTITKAIIEMMDGQISMESVYGQGTSVHFKIPKVLGDESLIPTADTKETALYAPDAEVLVVDDNQINLNVAAGLLQLHRIKIDTAKSGRQAIEMVKQKQYDMVFMDHMMPELNGVETTVIIRESGITVPIIALTASAIAGARETMLESGMDDYLAKPIIRFELVQMLRKWLPAEKLLDMPTETMTDSGALDEKHEKFWNEIGQIEGLFVSAGLDRLDGQRDVYKNTLKLMMQENTKSIKNLNKFLSTGDMNNFRIEVHGLKGALANVGAAELSAKALELEVASGKQNVAFCGKKLPALVEEINDLNTKLAQAFSVIDQNGGPIEIPPELPPIFQRMTKAFDEFDLVSIDREVEKMSALNLSGALKDETERLKDMVMMMEYDDAKEQMQKMLEG